MNSQSLSPSEGKYSLIVIQDKLVQGWRLYELIIEQRRHVCAEVLPNIQRVLDTLIQDTYLLNHTRDYLDDLILGIPPQGLPLLIDETPELKTLEWDILNPDLLIKLEIINMRRTSNI